MRQKLSWRQTVGCKKGGTQAEFGRGHLERSRSVQQSFAENHCILWMEVKVLEIRVERHVDMSTCLSTQYNMQNE
jgi:hypothetical protein